MDNTRKTKRSALLPTPADPFMFSYWLRLFENIWHEEIDKLYILANTPAEKQVTDYLEERVKRSPVAHKIDLTVLDHQIEHGDAIKRLLERAEDNIVLLEDDCYIFRSGAISEQFERLESGEKLLIGSKRGSCTPPIPRLAQERWGINYHGYGDQGCNFWPNLLFTSKSLLLATSQNFGARQWVKGETIAPLNHVVEVEAVAGDTFVEASLELRNLIAEDDIGYIPQYHTHPEDLTFYRKRESIWDGQAKYCHVGSLSSGFSGLIRDEFNRPLAYREIMEKQEATILPRQQASTPEEKREFERRVQMWKTFYDKREPDQLQEIAELYKRGIEQIIEQFGLSISNIHNRQSAYAKVGL